MRGPERPVLPESVALLLDGRTLESKAGHTFVLIAAEPNGWPRAALLSVGEVLAVSGHKLLLALYPDSRTTRALTTTRRGLLLVVADGAVHKLGLNMEPVPSGQGNGNSTEACFSADVETLDVDQVTYARVEHGIGFSLVDEQSTFERWEAKIERLRQLDA